MDSSMEKKSIEEIFPKKTCFRVINKHPALSDETAAQIRREMRRELNEIFKRHAP